MSSRVGVQQEPLYSEAVGGVCLFTDTSTDDMVASVLELMWWWINIQATADNSTCTHLYE